MNAEEVVQVTEIPDEVQRWTAKRKVALVMSVVKGETSLSEAARKRRAAAMNDAARLIGLSARQLPTSEGQAAQAQAPTAWAAAPSS